MKLITHYNDYNNELRVIITYPRRHPEFSALSKNLAIILLNNGATTCDMKTSSVFARIKFLWLCEPVFWLRRRRARRALLAWAKLYVYFGREQKYSYLLARKRHENSGWRLGLDCVSTGPLKYQIVRNSIKFASTGLATEHIW